MASLDPVAYLRQTPPFHALPGPLFDEAARGLDVSYQPTGTTLARVGKEPLRHLWVIRKGAVRLERDGQTLQVLEEGETFGYTSLITGKATIDVDVEEDLVAYRIPEKAFRLLLSDASFARHFAVGAVGAPPREPGALPGRHVPVRPLAGGGPPRPPGGGLGRRGHHHRAGGAGDAGEPHLVRPGALRTARDRHRPRPAEPGARRRASARPSGSGECSRARSRPWTPPPPPTRPGSGSSTPASTTSR